MSAEPIDYAEVQAEHKGHSVRGSGPFCVKCSESRLLVQPWPCLPYRLAVDAERLAGEREGAWDAGWASAYSGRVNAEQATVANPYRAALADQPEVQP